MTLLGGRPRALAAWLVVVSLLAPGSLGARTGCGICPTDCPMHQVVAEPATHDMPCHRAAEAPDARSDGPAVRAACGRAETGDLVVHLRDRSPGVMTFVLPTVDPPTRRHARVPAALAADVPTRPPRRVRSA